ncbi:hypothetical protein AXF42_Ash009532 [Apostasia shenzhenica]|uniref:Mitochondrial fission protein ELM1 n=1 Tax=Apostasia shenzhenica TaxID=1088818 RepID=A0A2I0B982_9ASPA|nr:hypothetical protein AXF42_Ash009532 [Apostasia shenzhenica]
MRRIRLPEPPSGSVGMPEIFEGGVNVIRRAVVIGNGFAGAENQSIGLVRALGLTDNHTLYRVIRPRGGVNEWLRWLPLSIHKVVDSIINQLLGKSRFYMTAQGKKMGPFPAQNGGNIGLSSILEADARHIASMARENFEKEGPLLVVASGWDTVSTTSSIKRLAPQNVFVIQIQHPRSPLDRFDLVVTPQHDYYALTPQGQEEVPRLMRNWITPHEPPGRNVVLTLGALHKADSAALRLAASEWHDELAPLPKPLLVVNIGGPTRYCRYGTDLAIQLAGSLHSVLPSCGSVRVSFSRRTPPKVSDVILRELGDDPKVYVWDGKDPNPHMGHLAWADAFIITADSISMLSEACSTGKPVYVIGAERCRWKFSAFHRSLREKGVVRPFTGLEDVSRFWSYPPLNDTAEAASRVRAALAERGWSLKRNELRPRRRRRRRSGSLHRNNHCERHQRSRGQ